MRSDQTIQTAQNPKSSQRTQVGLQTCRWTSDLGSGSGIDRLRAKWIRRRIGEAESIERQRITVINDWENFRNRKAERERERSEILGGRKRETEVLFIMANETAPLRSIDAGPGCPRGLRFLHLAPPSQRLQNFETQSTFLCFSHTFCLLKPKPWKEKRKILCFKIIIIIIK